MKNYIEISSKISSSGGTSTSYKTTIPKVILNKMEVESGDKLTWRLYDNSNKVEIIFTDKNSTNMPSNIDEPSKKTILSTTQTNNKKFTINIQINPHKQIAVINKETNKQITYLGITKRQDEEVKEIISKLEKCKTEEEIKSILKSYRENND